jgi:hypothetical protein
MVNITAINAVTPVTAEPQAPAEAVRELAYRDALARAIRRARGEEPIPDDERPIRVIGARADYSARMRAREHWFRMVYREHRWTYFTDYLEPIGLRAAQRHQTLYGDVYIGELLAQHDRGGPVDVLYLVADRAVPRRAGVDRESADQRGTLIRLDFYAGRDGKLRVELPDGSALTLPNPRRK